MRPMLCLLLFAAGLMVACGDNTESNQGAGGADYTMQHPRKAHLAKGSRIDTATQAVIVTADHVAKLDPHDTDNGGDAKVINQIYETLVAIDPIDVGKLQPCLAKSWTVDDKGMSITFTIRDNVTFHDGAKLDAAACKLSLDRMLGKAYAPTHRPYAPFFDFVSEIKADGMKLDVVLNRPVSAIALRNLSMFAASIVSPTLIEATKGKSPEDASQFVSEWAAGTGPFWLVSLDTSAKSANLQAHEGYWGGSPAIKSLLFRQSKDPNVRFEDLKSGKADMVDDLPRARWPEVEASPDYTLSSFWALNTGYLGVNVGHAKTQNIKIRKAIQLAVDRDALAALYDGTARPTYSMVAQPFPAYDPNLRVAGWKADHAANQALARQMIAESGVSGDGLKMKLYFPTDERPYLPKPASIADKLRQQLNEIGLNVEIEGIQNAEFFESIQKNGYELVLIGWMSDNGDPDNFYMPLTSGDAATKTPGTSNAGRLFDEGIHKALVEAQESAKDSERNAKYRAVEARLQNEFASYVPLINSKQAVAFGKRLSGVEIDGLGHYRFAKARLK